MRLFKSSWFFYFFVARFYFCFALLFADLRTVKWMLLNKLSSCHCWTLGSASGGAAQGRQTMWGVLVVGGGVTILSEHCTGNVVSVWEWGVSRTVREAHRVRTCSGNCILLHPLCFLNMDSSIKRTSVHLKASIERVVPPVFPYLLQSLLHAGNNWIFFPSRSSVRVKVYKFNDKMVYTVRVTEIEAHKSTVAVHKFPVPSSQYRTQRPQ